MTPTTDICAGIGSAPVATTVLPREVVSGAWRGFTLGQCGVCRGWLSLPPDGRLPWHINWHITRVLNAGRDATLRPRPSRRHRTRES